MTEKSSSANADQAPHERRPRTPVDSDDRGFRVSPAGDGRGQQPAKGRTGPRFPKVGGRFLAIVLALLAVNYISVALLAPAEEPTVRVPYSPLFLDQVRGGNVDKISSQGTTVEGEFKKEVRYPPDDKEAEPRKLFETEVPTFADTDVLSQVLRDNDVTINAEPINDGRGLLPTLLFSFGPVLLLVGLFIFLARRASGSGGPPGLGAFTRSKARRADPETQRVSFKDVAGIEEAKAELTEVVDFLRNPDRYSRLGGRIPHGVLLSGPPGTGKTLLARAVAGEADAPFFSVSASEFVEAIVGVGASRVRDLFKQAKEAAPAIIFIDELDAIGRSRSSGMGFGGGNDEREQTLNQILTEMDGFESDATVIVLGATNRPEILDSALLRPGRFDRRVTVPAPDREGRQKILDVHTRSLPVGADVELERIAASTPGMVGADLANLANEAALTAARRDHKEVDMSDFSEALDKILLGAPRGTMLSPADRRRTAYHEAGHALVGMLTPGADPVQKVSIIPRGMALGVTLSVPDNDRVSYDQGYLLTRIKLALGGRVAEELVLGDITTGAESDIQQLTEIARRMVGRWGMSPAIGPIAVLPSEPQGPLLPGSASSSEATQRVVDEEGRRIVDEAHAEVTQLLAEHREQLDNLSEALLEAETLDLPQAYAAAGMPRPTRDEDDEPVEPIALAPHAG